jgi:hypothetical protein
VSESLPPAQQTKTDCSNAAKPRKKHFLPSQKVQEQHERLENTCILSRNSLAETHIASNIGPVSSILSALRASRSVKSDVFPIIGRNAVNPQLHAMQMQMIKAAIEQEQTEVAS